MTATAEAAPASPAGPVEWVDTYLAELAQQRRLSPHTVAAYGGDLALLGQMVGATPLPELHVADVRRALARLHGQGAAPASLARALSAWRSFFDWLGDRGQVTVNPVAGVRAPRRAKRLPKALAPDQAVRLAAHAPAATPLAMRDKAVVELLYSSGLRLSELVGLDWRYFGAEAQFPASTGWLDLQARVVTVLGKGGKARTVPVGAPAADALRAWIDVRAAIRAVDARALFVSARGSRLSGRSVQLRLAQLARSLGLGVHVHPHVLRHSMASHVLQSSGDLRAVQELLGHASIATTQIYTRLDWQHLAKVYDTTHPRAKRKGG